MFIELAEFIRCPERHADDTYCVLVPEEMVGRSVMSGRIGCPVCEREYRIENGTASFGERDIGRGVGERMMLDRDPAVLQALLGLETPGGFVILAGSAVAAAGALAGQMAGVHFVAVNPPVEAEPSPHLSLLSTHGPWPLRHSFARGVILGPEYTRAMDLSEGTRVLLNRQRLIVPLESVDRPDLQEIATGRGLWVGEKLGRVSLGESYSA